MDIGLFDFDLPEELIAQKPMEKRDGCRLMVVDREHDTVDHKIFSDIIEYLNPGDCLVLNDSKVLPARLFGKRKETGGKVEFLLIKRLEGDVWETMVRPGKKVRPGDVIEFSSEEGHSLEAQVLDYGEDGTRHVRFRYDGIFMERLEEIGSMPLPPYIERPSDEEDKDSYQTVYCKYDGSVAAPTAGLHFTSELLQAIKDKGIALAYVTLHVGIGTFRPVKTDNIEEHHMHFEEYSVSEEAAKLINDTKLAGGRVISVGTTSTRTVESCAKWNKEKEAYLVEPGNGATDIFIYPGYEFKIIDLSLIHI